MMVIANKIPSSLHICEYCNALLAYTADDVYENHYIYCPICKTRQRCKLDLEWDGLIT